MNNAVGHLNPISIQRLSPIGHGFSSHPITYYQAIYSNYILFLNPELVSLGLLTSADIFLGFFFIDYPTMGGLVFMQQLL
jgi:hypothetical protein